MVHVPVRVGLCANPQQHSQPSVRSLARSIHTIYRGTLQLPSATSKGGAAGLHTHSMQPLSPLLNVLDAALKRVTRGPYSADPVEVPNESYSGISDCNLYSSALAALQAHSNSRQVRAQFAAVNRVDRFWYLHNTWEYARAPKNWAKNRYVNVLPFDHNRVRLRTTRRRDNYINASHMVDPLLAGLEPDIEPATPTGTSTSPSGAEDLNTVDQNGSKQGHQPVEEFSGTRRTSNGDEGGKQLFRGLDPTTAQAADEVAGNGSDSDADSTMAEGTGQDQRDVWEPAAAAARAVHGGWAYIGTQGPTSSTTPDFWRMVLENNVTAIVMLCNTVEDGRPKCAQYFPREAGEKLMAGPFEVTALEVSQLEPEANVRQLSVRNTEAPGEPASELSHFHYHAWPDQGLPSNLGSLRRISVALDDCRRPGSNIVVHCSAGIGRTGTFMGMDIMRQRLMRLPDLVRGAAESDVEGAGSALLAKALDVGGLVAGLRQQRMGMVQTLGQFAFLCQAVITELRELRNKRCSE